MDDTVYRKDVIKALEDMSGGYSYIETTTLGAITTIRELPSAQRTGRWIKNDNGKYSCNQCHFWIPNEQHYYARYCIYCGARMEEQE